MAKVHRCRVCEVEISRFSKTKRCLDCVWKEKRAGGAKGVSGTGNIVDVSALTTDKVKTLADVIRVCEIDTDAYQIIEWTANAWSGASGDQMFQVKARLRPKVEILAIKDEIAALLADAKKQIEPRATVKTRTDGDYLLLLNIPDLHAGKLAWKEETGHANYDTKIAIDLFNQAVDTLLGRVSGFRFKEVVLVIGNDLMNVDNRNNTTHMGTPQSTDSRFQKTFLQVRRMVTNTIERVQHRLECKVIVVFVPGNHDLSSTWHLGDSVECFFHKTKGVVIDNAPTPRKYREFGKNMLMFTHGDKGKRQNYPAVMAAEQPEMFGRTRYREAHTGHLHQLRVQEHFGVRVRISPALCPPDAWHSDNQYIGQQRAAEAFVYHANEGHVATAVFTVQE